MGEWKEFKLGDIVEIGSSKRIFYSEYVDEGIPFYRSKEIIEKHKRNNISTELQISTERFEEIKNKFGVPGKGDILLTSVGTLGVPYIVQKGEKFYFKDGNLTWFRNYDENLLNTFLYYWIVSPVGKNELDMISIGSTQAALTIVGLKSLEIALPPLPEQKAIASVLSSLDDKIDLLYRQNKTLEAMAETLFRQWFVEEAQDDSGTIKVSDVIDVLSGFAFKSTVFNESGKFRLITIKAVQDGYLELSGANRIDKIPSKMPDYCSLKKGDILLSLTGNVGRCCMVDAHGLLLNQRVAKLRAKNERDWAFTYILFRQSSMKQCLEEMAKGTAQANLSPIDTAKMEMSLPPLNMLDLFNSVATPLLQRVLFNKKQIRTLEKLRDTLLPKLMSGEIRVEYEH